MAEGVVTVPDEHRMPGAQEPAKEAAGEIGTIRAGQRLTAGDLTALPEVPDNGNVAVHTAWARVMGDVQFIAKSRRTEQGAKYNYRGIDDVVNTVGPVLRRHGVAVIPVGVTPDFEVINTTKGSAMNYCRVVARFMVLGPRGDSFIGEALGEGFDSGDKSGSKASSVALRTFYVQALAIPTNQPEQDTEYGIQHEIAGPPRPTPQQYAAWINDEGTSIARLHQIKAELDGDPSLGMATVEGLDGEQIQLGRLIRIVGQARTRKTEEGS